MEVNNALDNVATAYFNGVIGAAIYGAHADFEGMAIQAIGSYVGQAAGGAINAELAPFVAKRLAQTAAPASHYFAAQTDGRGVSQSPDGYCAWDGRDHSSDDPTNYSSSDYHNSATTPDTKQPNSSTAPIRVNDPQTGVPDWFSDAFDQSMRGVDQSMLSFPAANDSTWANVHTAQQGLDYLRNLNTLARADIMQDAGAAWQQFASHPGASLWSMAVGAGESIGHAALFLSNAAQFVFTKGVDTEFGTNLAQTSGSQAWANQFVSDVKGAGLSLVQNYRSFAQGNVQQQARMLANGTEGFLQTLPSLFAGAGAARGLSWLGDLGVSESMGAEGLDSREILISENRQRSAFLREKYSYWNPVQRQARIEELAFGNRFLRVQGVPGEYISQVLQSFEPGQLALQFADDSTYGLRFYGGGARDISPYLNPTFPFGDVRSLNALPPVNQANKIMQWQVAPGSPFLFGRIRANFGQPGGGLQLYVPNFESNLVRPES